MSSASHDNAARQAEERRRAWHPSSHDNAARRVVVVGSGVAGLTAGLRAHAAGADVTIVTKSALADTATAHAQGGIAAVVFADDSPASHEADTIAAGAGLADPDAVRALVADGTHAIADLIDCGVAFDRDDSGRLSHGLEAAHSVARVLHAGGDATGAEIQRALIAAVRADGIAVRERETLVDLVLAAGDEAAVVGARVMDPSGGVEVIAADAVILATGGAGRVYARTTNPPIATGDGIAAAIRAGAAVREMEFVQFHPTVLAAGEPFLVSEAVRGAGAVLVDQHGRRFCLDAHPAGELAPRDVVAHAIAERVAAQGGRPVFLDATALGGAYLARRFPTIDRAVASLGLDWGREPIPVVPAAHYLMGGVATDLDGRTSVCGLFAAGETARTGVHGANRLASNSLLEGAVFGARAGRAAAEYARGSIADRAPTEPSSCASPRGGATLDRAALGALMWRHAGLARDEAGLAHAASRIDAWLAALDEPSLPRDVEDRSLLVVAREIVRAARARTESVGAHHRSDTVRVAAAL